MAIWQECDRCGVTTKDAGPELWAICTLSVPVGNKVKGHNNASFDLCPRCYQETRTLLTSGRNLTGEQQALLAQIWDNAQKFDQSIGDAGRP